MPGSSQYTCVEAILWHLALHKIAPLPAFHLSWVLGQPLIIGYQHMEWHKAGHTTLELSVLNIENTLWQYLEIFCNNPRLHTTDAVCNLGLTKEIPKVKKKIPCRQNFLCKSQAVNYACSVKFRIDTKRSRLVNTKFFMLISESTEGV